MYGFYCQRILNVCAPKSAPLSMMEFFVSEDKNRAFDAACKYMEDRMRKDEAPRWLLPGEGEMPLKFREMEARAIKTGQLPGQYHRSDKDHFAQATIALWPDYSPWPMTYEYRVTSFKVHGT